MEEVEAEEQEMATIFRDIVQVVFGIEPQQLEEAVEEVVQELLSH